MTTRLKNYFAIKRDPNLATLKFLEGAESMADKMTRRVVDETLKQIIEDFKQRIKELIEQLETSIPGISKQITEEMREMVYSDAETFKGPEGEKGDSIIGPEGPIGPKPIAGIDYPVPKDGKEGLPGPIGKDGKDGSPDNPEQMAKKLNTLEEKVKINVIKGLAQVIEDIKSNIRRGTARGGGGGMGNSIHEVHDLTSATTTITLGYNIAGNGTAIFGARYQGQVMDLGVHYSVSNRIITLLFIPDDNTKFSISYVRT